HDALSDEVDPNQIRGGGIGEEARYHVVLDQRAAHRDPVDVGPTGGTAGIHDAIVPHDSAVVGGIAVEVDADGEVVVEVVVFHQVPASAVQAHAKAEAADGAVPDRHVLAFLGVDPVGIRRLARGKAADLEIVAVEGDVVGSDGDGVAAGDSGAQVLAQAPGALGGNGGR